MKARNMLLAWIGWNSLGYKAKPPKTYTGADHAAVLKAEGKRRRKAAKRLSDARSIANSTILLGE